MKRKLLIEQHNISVFIHNICRPHKHLDHMKHENRSRADLIHQKEYNKYE